MTFFDHFRVGRSETLRASDVVYDSSLQSIVQFDATAINIAFIRQIVNLTLIKVVSLTVFFFSFL